MFNSNTFNSFKVNKKPNIPNIKTKFPKNNNKKFIGEYYNKNINYNPLFTSNKIIINDITQNNFFCENSQQFLTIPHKEHFSYINLVKNLKDNQNCTDGYNLESQKLSREKLNKNDFLIKNIEMISKNRNLTNSKEKCAKTNLIEHRNKNRNIMFANINLI